MKKVNRLLFLLSISYAISCCVSFAGNDNNIAKRWEVFSDTTLYQIISKGEAAGEYQAFPDACRLQNGDIVTVFYAGEDHVTYPNDKYPKAGRICLVRSTDEGKTWSDPEVIYDDFYDNRDPHIGQLSDGTLALSFFSLELHEGSKELLPKGIHILRSFDNGINWNTETQLIVSGEEHWFCSAPIREVADGTLILPVYYQLLGSEVAYGGVFLSYDKGASWSKVVTHREA
ncbi:sialidase family protein [Catalinimonas niigatensis]|uniref:sialidase family protein n=1 Tax=Catalinimonas niigatensis TaxID=1397264 RepID=UPI0026664469|nr:sialidase family protein [Catalinimonas niigatensis]WPP48802.1 sialidase family protein [Catalinimonas niigatensis]